MIDLDFILTLVFVALTACAVAVLVYRQSNHE